MGDESGAVRGAMLTALFKPSPGIGILKFWQGIVEIVLRAGSLVLLFILFICSCAALGSLPRSVTIDTLQRDATAAAGWILFVTIVAMIVEGLILVARFLNFGFVSKFSTIVHIVDIVISFVIAVAIFCGAIAVAVYSGRYRALTPVPGAEGLQVAIVASTGATAAFGFFTLFVFVGLGVFMIVSVIMKWRNTSTYSVPGVGGGEDGDGYQE